MTPMTRIQALAEEVAVTLEEASGLIESLHGAGGELRLLRICVTELRGAIDDYAKTFPRFARG